ncbi:Y-family DNA polymerase [Pseudooctadecabacter sp.]|uniref:Y-family DNA polymerase n=1 Tax=Pseudooctadecabacter sp. TaxID=1966338 RepID=UPI00345A83B4
MRGEDKLPVLPFPTPPRPAKPQGATPQRSQDTAQMLAHAIAALHQAMVTPPVDLSVTDLPPPDAQAEEAFTPVGIPPSTPRWRASTTPTTPLDPKVGRVGVAAGAVTPPDPKDPLARRITALHFPRFSMNRWQWHMDRAGQAPPPEVPVALAVEGPHGPVIHATNRAADQHGIRIGARVVDMRALVPDLRVDFADVGGDRAALGRLMLWVRRWCPWSTVDGPAGLVMDTTGSDHLWGGEAAMLREIEGKLSTLGLETDLATAPTHGAAWALSRCGGVREVCAPQDLATKTAPLPVRALRLHPDTVLLLKRLGLKTVGALADVPRLSLARRFQKAELVQNPLLRLDQLMGRMAEPLQSPDDPPQFCVQSSLPEPVMDPEPHLPDMAQELCAGLHAAGLGARRITLTVYRTDGEVDRIGTATSQASRDAAHILRLFDGKLERLNPGFGFDLITLEASVVEHVDVVQTRIEGGSDEGTELARLVDRLSAKFGADNIRRPAPRDSHIPERREGWHPAMAPDAAPLPAHPRPRPLRLLQPPEDIRVLYAVPEGPPAQFMWRRQTHKVVRFEGPERIAPEWWADRPGTRLRDYYRIEDQHGCRYWLFREGVVGDGRGGAPRWCVQGLFA